MPEYKRCLEMGRMALIFEVYTVLFMMHVTATALFYRVQCARVCA